MYKKNFFDLNSLKLILFNINHTLFILQKKINSIMIIVVNIVINIFTNFFLKIKKPE